MPPAKPRTRVLKSFSKPLLTDGTDSPCMQRESRPHWLTNQTSLFTSTLAKQFIWLWINSVPTTKGLKAASHRNTVDQTHKYLDTRYKYNTQNWDLSSNYRKIGCIHLHHIHIIFSLSTLLHSKNVCTHQRKHSQRRKPLICQLQVNLTRRTYCVGDCAYDWIAKEMRNLRLHR